MVVGDSQGCAGGLTIEWRCQSDAAVNLCAIGVAVLGEQILTCKDTEKRNFSILSLT